MGIKWAVLTLAVGIGANTTRFSVVNGVLLNPLTYLHSEQLEAVYVKTPGFDQDPVVYLNFLDWQRTAETFSSMAIYHNQDYNVTGAGASAHAGCPWRPGCCNRFLSGWTAKATKSTGCPPAGGGLSLRPDTPSKIPTPITRRLNDRGDDRTALLSIWNSQPKSYGA